METEILLASGKRTDECQWVTRSYEDSLKLLDRIPYDFSASDTPCFPEWEAQHRRGNLILTIVNEHPDNTQVAYRKYTVFQNKLYVDITRRANPNLGILEIYEFPQK